jgi:hypothetical protein
VTLNPEAERWMMIHWEERVLHGFNEGDPFSGWLLRASWPMLTNCLLTSLAFLADAKSRFAGDTLS